MSTVKAWVGAAAALLTGVATALPSGGKLGLREIMIAVGAAVPTWLAVWFFPNKSA